MSPREVEVIKKEKELAALDASLRELQDELNSARVVVEKRDKDLTEKEEQVLSLLARSQEYDTAIIELANKYQAQEEKVLAADKASAKMLEDMSARREEVLAKLKVLQEQETLLAESKRLVMSEQRRFVDWERTMNEREADLGSRERSLKRAAALPKMEAAPKAEERREWASERKKEPEEIPAAKQEVMEPEAVESEEAGLAEAFCPECRTIVSASADTCYACGADLKNPKPHEAPQPKAEEKAEEKRPERKAEEKVEEKPAEGEAKKSVSIRKIIKRK